MNGNDRESILGCNSFYPLIQTVVTKVVFLEFRFIFALLALVDQCCRLYQAWIRR